MKCLPVERLKKVNKQIKIQKINLKHTKIKEIGDEESQNHKKMSDFKWRISYNNDIVCGK
jgi:hypothetical protein